MSAQAAFYPTDPSLGSSVGTERVFMGNEYPPEFLSLSLLDRGNYRQEMGMPSMQYQADYKGTMQAVAPNMQGEAENANQPRLRNRALRPAPRDSRKESTDIELHQVPPFSHPSPSVPNLSSFSFTGSGDPNRDAEFSLDNDRVSPHSDMSSIKSSSPLRWQNGGTDKRAKHLERNRAAASKSRQKKKRETDLLRTRFQDVSRRRYGLEEEIKALHSQLLSLKDQILMHSRCDDEAIHRYLGRMVKQATQHDSVSSASTAEPDDPEVRYYGTGSGSISPGQDAMAGFHGHPQHHHAPNPSELDLVRQRHMQMRMGEATGLPCGVEKPMMNQMFTQAPNGNIFDLQISIG
ncbi:hypothetical protein BJX76DRAFT_322678 [Aspergillus varians]